MAPLLDHARSRSWRPGTRDPRSSDWLRPERHLRPCDQIHASGHAEYEWHVLGRTTPSVPWERLALARRRSLRRAANFDSPNCDLLRNMLPAHHARGGGVSVRSVPPAIFRLGSVAPSHHSDGSKSMGLAETPL